MPHAPLVVPTLLLIAILVVSAVAKIRDPGDTFSVFSKLGLPGILIRLRAPRLLPFVELALAAAVLVSSGVWYVAATSLMLALFVAYTAVILRALSLRKPITCGCFGRLGLGRVTRYTLVRNVVLAAIALVTWLDSWRGEGVGQRLLHLGSAWWWLGGVALAIVTTALVVHEGKAPPLVPPLRDTSDSYVARPIPYALLDGPDGPAPIWRLTDAAARLFVFYRPDTDVAAELLSRVPVWAEQIAPVDLHLVGPGEWSALCHYNPEMADRLLGDPDLQTMRSLGVYSTPAAVLLGTDRLLAGGPVDGLAGIDDLVEAAAEEIRHAAEAATAAESSLSDAMSGATAQQGR